MSLTVAVVGAGTIGRSFAWLFARSGYAVRVHDPRDDLAEVVASLQADVSADAAAEDLEADRIGVIELAETVEAAVAGARFVQESGPEDPERKTELFARIADHAPDDAVLATSSSTIPASAIAAGLPASAARRVIVGHPFNPPHLMPLVEVVPSVHTDPAVVEAAVGFYRSCGRRPVVLGREVRGFVGNRLQNALMKEAISLVGNGVITAGELDEVMRNSLGLRWSAVGLFEGMHLGGGEAGIRGFLDHIGPAFAAIDDLPADTVDIDEIVAQVEDAYGPRPSREAAEARDRIQRAVLHARSQEP
ncbi:MULTISPECIES: 3-hydroxyacyl-CoA dehydrogenase NAD-binding domain-containing protein [Brevibacterium]|nr:MULTISPECIES: 3-hydroxyacyl-CoA dehydrogenase NAD-binding domain-containing protein [Brevibacterium]